MVQGSPGQGIDKLAVGLAALFVLDRLGKGLVAERFFGQPPPPAPAPWPSVTILQPITRGWHDLPATLAARARLDYPAPVQHLLICDAADAATQAMCRAWMAANPALDATLLAVPPDGGEIASKIAKLQAALPQARGDVICFLDDDVRPRPAALRQLVPYLDRPGVGAAFGQPCYINWDSPWSSLLSGLTNGHALLSFTLLPALIPPFRLTGHFVAMRRAVFLASGGLEGLAGQLDDDYAIAQRLRAAGLHLCQTPLIYDVDVALPTFAAYTRQLHRWFVLPRQAMIDSLHGREMAALTTALALGPLLPGLIALLALGTRRRATGAALMACVGAFAASYAWAERRILGRHTPLARWPLLALVLLVAPAHTALMLLGGDTVEWRGQRLRVGRDGRYTVLVQEP